MKAKETLEGNDLNKVIRVKPWVITYVTKNCVPGAVVLGQKCERQMYWQRGHNNQYILKVEFSSL